MEMKNVKRALAAVLAASTLVSGAVSTTADAYTGTNVDSVSMTMPLVAASTVSVVASAGYEEGAYAVWAPVDGADGYNVYCDGVQLDSMLIRQFKVGSFRADAVGS